MLITKDALKKHKMDRVYSAFTPLSFEDNVNLSGVKISQDVRIGRHTYMNDGSIRDRVDIGRFCSIGRNVTIAAGDHPLQCLTTHPIAWQTKDGVKYKNRVKRSIRTTIGHDVWIGDNVIVVPGVTIGTGAVIGANAVVTKDVLPYMIVGGVPAKPIRSRFTESIVNDLLRTEWWMLKDDSIKQLDINEIEECIKRIPEFKIKFGEEKFCYITIGDDDILI